jgi:uncharacterized membrane protein YsdA (DUF1294 family)
MAKSSIKQSYALYALILVVLIGIILYWLTKWDVIWIWLGAINLVTFAAYGYDKNQAKSGGMRVPEVVLHGLAIAGGFLGGWLGRQYFRHKTQKPAFAWVLAASTIVWLGILYFIIFR